MILLFSSRVLCYESNLVFIKSMSEALERLGRETEIIELDDDWENELMSIEGGRYEALIDFNSLLPRMENDDGSLYLDRFDAPFFNYIVDHPMYHHPGLIQKLKGYHVLTVDRCHEKYVRDNYSNIAGVSYLPLTGKTAESVPDFKDRKHEITVMATMTDEESIFKDIRKFPKPYQKYIFDIADIIMSLPNELQEDIARKYMLENALDEENADFATFMNNICMADKLARYRRREAFFKELFKSGLPVTLIGNGWESTLEKMKAKNVKYIGDVRFSVSYNAIANSKILVNLSPEFHGGVHDRVFSGMAAGCAVLTDDNPVVSETFADGKNVSLYDRADISDFMQKLHDLYENQSFAKDLGQNAVKHYKENDTWDARMCQFLDLLL
ncbi:MAG: glycosyltransferase [Lachnospiraceae bacterium]|nr:glycosyltransferase [Lachnospiraceae bacterium]